MFFIVFYYFTAVSGTVPETHKSVNIQITISIVGHLHTGKKKVQRYENFPNREKRKFIFFSEVP